MKAWQWIDQACALNGWPSDYRAAKELSLSRAAISVYRSKPMTTMDDDTAVRVAHAVGRDPGFVVLDQVIERSKSDAAKEALRRVQKQLQRQLRDAAAAGPRRRS